MRRLRRARRAHLTMSSHYVPLWPARLRVDLPKANATKKSISVVSKLNALWQFVESLGIPAAKNKVISNERFLQQQGGVKHFAFPPFFAQFFHSRSPKIVLDHMAVAVRQIAEFQWKHVV